MKKQYNVYCLKKNVNAPCSNQVRTSRRYVFESPFRKLLSSSKILVALTQLHTHTLIHDNRLTSVYCLTHTNTNNSTVLFSCQTILRNVASIFSTSLLQNQNPKSKQKKSKSLCSLIKANITFYLFVEQQIKTFKIAVLVEKRINKFIHLYYTNKTISKQKQNKRHAEAVIIFPCKNCLKNLFLLRKLRDLE